MKRKILSLFLVLTAVILVGCGSKEPQNKIVLKSDHSVNQTWMCTIMDGTDVIKKEDRKTTKLDKEVDGKLETTITYSGLKKGTATIKCSQYEVKSGKNLQKKEFKAVVDKDLTVKITEK